MPTVSLLENTVSRFVRDNGMLIWWNASASSVANGSVIPKRYRERFPYGGAPRAELSAVGLMDFFVKEKPEIIEAFLTYLGVYYSPMGERAAADIKEWFENKGRLVRTVQTPHGEVTMSLKPIINMEQLTRLG